MFNTRDLPKAWRDRIEAAGKPVAATMPKEGAHTMNKWERQYAMRLKLSQAQGTVVWWAFEPMRFALNEPATGRRRLYTPDFVVVHASGLWQCVEVKGHCREAAMLRFDWAAQQHPQCEWIMVRPDHGAWITIRKHTKELAHENRHG